MRVTLDWLKDFVDIKKDLEGVRHALTMAGLEVTSVIDFEDDKVMDIEVTPNRPDCLSVLGIARELSAWMGKDIKIPASIKKGINKSMPSKGSAKIDIEDKNGCPRYVGCILKNVTLGPSPDWLIKRLNAQGARSVNNIVDITNYVLFETGQPLHAFDLDKLAGKKIIVRRAKKGETIVTIDGIKRDLDSDMLIIADQDRPVAIAGIMGGKDTEITEGTRNILLESAYFAPVAVRKAQRKLGLASESSYRFERGVDFAMILAASMRASELIKSIAKARGVGTPTDIGEKPIKEEEIALCLDEIPRVLGVEIERGVVIDIFKRLNLKLVKKIKDRVTVKVPSYRGDIRKEIDLIEEVARLYGYDKIPVKLPGFTIAKTYQAERKELSLAKDIRKLLSSLGLTEIITYSLASKASVERLGFPSADLIKLQNPLSSLQEVMRPTLLTEMLEAISWNLNRQNALLELFELNKVYLIDRETGEHKERLYLSIGMCGTASGNWKDKSRGIDFFDLKGVVEGALSLLGVQNFSIDKMNSFVFRDHVSTHIKIAGKRCGILGQVKPDIARSFDIKEKVFLCEIFLEDVLDCINLKKRFRPLSKFPSMIRDVAVLVDDNVISEAIVNVIKEAGGDLVKSIDVFDFYKGYQIPEGKRSLAYTVEYRSSERTLEDQEVAKIHKGIEEALVKKLGAQIR